MIGLLWAILLLAGCNQLLKPPLPVEVAYRKSLVNEGYVAIFQNQSDKYLEIELEALDPTTNIKKVGRFDLDAYSKMEVGWLQGWKFRSGDIIKIYNAGYRPYICKLP